jgi:hypothetical protein
VKGAMRGRLIKGLITNETMVELLLETFPPACRSVGTRHAKYFPGLLNHSFHLKVVPTMICGP